MDKLGSFAHRYLRLTSYQVSPLQASSQLFVRREESSRTSQDGKMLFESLNPKAWVETRLPLNGQNLLIIMVHIIRA